MNEPTIENGKLIRRNESGTLTQVALIYSPGYGGGFSSWDTKYPGCIYCPELALGILNGGTNLHEIVERLFPGLYVDWESGLRVEWVELGKPYYLHEHDGSEWIVTDFPIA